MSAAPRKRLAVIGGGAKAAAIAARSDVLERVCGAGVEIVIFEELEIGANWSGAGGYTDGEAPLCTPAERDIGFPYDPGSNRLVGEELLARYSWSAYLVATGTATAGPGLKDWVNRGRRPPSHAVFAAYLKWAVKRSGAVVVKGRVTRLQPLKTGWRVHSLDAGCASTHDGFSGVVVTGPGPAMNRIARIGTAGSRVVDGRSFWLNPSGFLAQSVNFEEPVVIVGAGGTSAAIAARSIADRSVKMVVIVGDQAALFARTESFFESQIFSDDNLWRSLSPRTRREFTDRLNRGVVWATISDALSRSSKVRFRPGRGSEIETKNTPMRDGSIVQEIVVRLRREAGSANAVEVPAGLVVDASGFDPWWFLSLLPKSYASKAFGRTDDATSRKRRRLMEAMEDELVLFDGEPGPIHAPMLSQSVGPGFASLMVLGSMSERILRRYAA